MFIKKILSIIKTIINYSVMHNIFCKKKKKNQVYIYFMAFKWVSLEK